VIKVGKFGIYGKKIIGLKPLIEIMFHYPLVKTNGNRIIKIKLTFSEKIFQLPSALADG